jgi:DNA-binding transcriptional ArsR family regulator
MTGRLIRRPDRPRRRAAIRRIGPAVLADPIALPETPGAFPSSTQPGFGQLALGTATLGVDLGMNSGRASSGAMLAFARETYNIRRRRGRFLPADLFGEPTWDILLDLYVATRENRPVPTTSACIGAHVPPTTALRWLRILEARGLVEREEDDRDGRRTFVRLSERGLAAMEDWLQLALTTLDQTVGAIMRLSAAMGGAMAEAAE